MDDWNIEKLKIICAVTDNGANMKAAIDIFLGPRSHIRCFAHTLNLCVQDIMKSVPEFNLIVDKVKKIVTFFKQSVKASLALKDEQKREKDEKLLTSKQSCDTR